MTLRIRLNCAQPSPDRCPAVMKLPITEVIPAKRPAATNAGASGMKMFEIDFKKFFTGVLFFSLYFSLF
ncbi:hypothetical protein D3C81_1817670 [compost metagenome]